MLELEAARAAPPRRPRAARRVGSAVASRCCSSCPGQASARASGLSGLRVIQPKISVEAATAPSGAAARAGPRSCVGRLRGERRRRPPSVSEQRADAGASRSARAPSGARLAVLVACRSRCARRRGRRRARQPRSASAAGASESSAAERARAASGLRRDESLDRPAPRARVPTIAASTLRALERQPRLGQPPAGPAAAARTTSASRAGPRRSGFSTSAARRRLYSGGDLQLAVRRCARRTPRRAGRARARRSRAPCRRAGSCRPWRRA